MTKTANMIQNRIDTLEQWGSDGELTGDLFMFGIGEYNYLKELAESEREETKEREITIDKLVKTANEYQEQLTTAFRITSRLVNQIEKTTLDCDAEVYDELSKILDVLAK